MSENFLNDILNEGSGLDLGGSLGGMNVGGAGAQGNVQSTMPVQAKSVEEIFDEAEIARRKANTEGHQWIVTLVDKFDETTEGKKLTTKGFIFSDPAKGQEIFTSQAATAYVVENCLMCIGTGENSLVIEKRQTKGGERKLKNGTTKWVGPKVSFYLRPATKGVAIHREGKVIGIKQPANNPDGSPRMRKANNDTQVRAYEVKPEYVPIFGQTTVRQKGESAIPNSNPMETFLEAALSGQFKVSIK